MTVENKTLAIQSETSVPKVLVLSNVNMVPIKSALKWALPTFGEFNDYLQVLSEEGSLAYNESWDAIVIHLDGETLFEKKSVDDAAAEGEMYISLLEKFCEERPSCTVLASLLTAPAITAMTFAESTIDHSTSAHIERLNQELRALSNQVTNLALLNPQMITLQHGTKQLLNPNFWYAGRIRYSNLMFKELSRAYRLLYLGYQSRAKKVLVLDLDNTLWGGVLGEDGPLGVKLSEDGVGKCFRDLQRLIAQLTTRGVLLAINSKNNISDVEEMFSKNSMMLLTQSDFAAIKANWQDKVQNLRELSEDLSLGLDSFVFLDDNPVERQLVAENLPEVIVPTFPTRPEEIPQWFLDQVVLEYFPVYRVTAEDRKKTEQYSRNSQRESLKRNIDREAFLKSLNIEVKYIVDSSELVNRASQMTQKTNQFNMTTKRYTPAQIAEFIASDSHRVILLDYRDRFGEEGITGLAIVNCDSAEIDSLLLSCRIIGRGVEEGLLRKAEELLAASGQREIKAEFIPTQKNTPARGFYSRAGYNLLQEREDGRQLYQSVLE